MGAYSGPKIKAMLEKGAIEEVDLCHQYLVSPFFAVPKKDPVKVRPILNLRHLNAHVRYDHFKMEGLASVKGPTTSWSRWISRMHTSMFHWCFFADVSGGDREDKYCNHMGQPATFLNGGASLVYRTMGNADKKKEDKVTEKMMQSCGAVTSDAYAQFTWRKLRACESLDAFVANL